jgi:hypothetical protein
MQNARKRKGGMKREQDKRLEYERLVENDRITNAVGLVGELTELKQVENLCGAPFNGYVGKVQTIRPSGTADEVAIVIPEQIADAVEKWGRRFLFTGKIQTLKDFRTGHVLVFVLVDYFTESEKAAEQNDVVVAGELAHAPGYRETPKGKRIADFILKVQNEVTGGMCYIPCICWNGTAVEAMDWQPGDKVKLIGHCQSRKYIKWIATQDGQEEWTSEQRVAYEVSAHTVRRTGGKNDED